MVNTKVVNRSYWTEPLVLYKGDILTYEQIQQDEKYEQIEIDASHWVCGNDYSDSCDCFAYFMWIVRIGSIGTLLVYTSEAGYEIAWVIALIILFVLSCGSFFVCDQRRRHAWEDNTGYVRTDTGQALMKKIDEWDQKQMALGENPTRVVTASAPKSRYPRQNFKLLKY